MQAWKTKVNKNMMMMSCPLHIVHNAFQTGAEHTLCNIKNILKIPGRNFYMIV